VREEKFGAVIVGEKDVDTRNQQTVWTMENGVAKQK